MKNDFYVTLGPFNLRCIPRYSKTKERFPRPDYSKPCVGEPVFISEDDWKEYNGDISVDPSLVEFSTLSMYFSDALLKFDCMIFHAAAILFHNEAYLICAPSGTGKSTQAKGLHDLHPEEFSVICGDRPVLSFLEDHIRVYPSPWNGKENWHGAEAAPLRGVVLLERGIENAIERLKPGRAAALTYRNVVQTSIEKENIVKAAELITQMLYSVDVWKLTTFMVPESTKLLYDAVFTKDKVRGGD